MKYKHLKQALLFKVGSVIIFSYFSNLQTCNYLLPGNTHTQCDAGIGTERNELLTGLA